MDSDTFDPYTFDREAFESDPDGYRQRMRETAAPRETAAQDAVRGLTITIRFPETDRYKAILSAIQALNATEEAAKTFRNCPDIALRNVADLPHSDKRAVVEAVSGFGAALAYGSAVASALSHSGLLPGAMAILNTIDYQQRLEVYAVMAAQRVHYSQAAAFLNRLCG